MNKLSECTHVRNTIYKINNLDSFYDYTLLNGHRDASGLSIRFFCFASFCFIPFVCLFTAIHVTVDVVVTLVFADGRFVKLNFCFVAFVDRPHQLSAITIAIVQVVVLPQRKILSKTIFL